MARGTRGALVAFCALATLAACRSRPAGAVADGTLILNKGVPLRTEHNMVVHIRGQDAGHTHDYTVLFGAYPPGAGAYGEGKYVTSAPTWHTSGGYTYAIGWWPMIQTPRVMAASEGTIVVIWLDAAFDRVFLLEPARSTRLNLTTIEPVPDMAVLERESYIEATGPIGGPIDLTGPTPIPTSSADPIRQFLDYVLGIVAAADLSP